MEILGVKRLELFSADIERSRSFYENLGGRMIEAGETAYREKYYDIDFPGGFVLRIHASRSEEEIPEMDGWNHISLTVSNLDAACNAAWTNGGVIEEMPDRHRDGRVRNAVVSGPDGERIEFIEQLNVEHANIF